MTKSENTTLTLFEAKDLDIDFPEHNDLVPEAVALATQRAILDNGNYTPDGKAFVEKSALPQLLGTDKVGANEFYNDLPNADKRQNGNARLVNIGAVMGEQSRRIQEPFSANKTENLKHAEECLRAYRDHPELERRRTVHEAQIRQNWPKVRALARERVTHCEVTGQLLEQTPHVHHIIRRADNPSLSLDPQNLVVVNREPHKKIHRSAAHSPDKLDELAKAQNWPWRKEKKGETNI